ncbi:hypothetical protein [Pseudomonas sp. TMP25]|uniref:hypothetical protein n=1 Tax=Pseudomonas sp. TMP25 TaxID=3136561 RepID=UPI00310110F1
MAKGQARIVLHGKREFLIRSLRELMTLSDITKDLARDGLQVSVSSLYRYMISDLGDDYAEYLWHTGRGLLRSRQGEFRGRVMSKARVIKTVATDRGKISNQADLNNFFKNNK